MRVAHRFSKPGMPYEGLTRATSDGPKWTGKVATVPEKLMEPYTWKKPRRVFVNSMSDLFHESVPVEFIQKVWQTMEDCEQHTFQILTKRPERMAAILNANYIAPWAPLPNVWIGTSVEDQATADDRIPHLLATPAAVRFISAEPLLSSIDIRGAHFCPVHDSPSSCCLNCKDRVGLDWVVTGGESGPGSRPMHPDWARGLRDQCAQSGVPFFFKQWGEHLPSDQNRPGWEEYEVGMLGTEGGRQIAEAIFGGNASPTTTFDDGTITFRVGKKAAGRLLDGREHNEYPKTHEGGGE